MDKLTLKSTIIELRDSGMSYQEISDFLRQNYNIHMTRQAVCGMYKRVTSEENKTKEITKMLSVTDILNVYCLGLNLNEIKDVIGIDITLADIRRIIESNNTNISEIRNSQINKIINSINNNSDINDIRKFLTYKGIEIKESAFIKLVEMASERLIRNEISRDIVKIYNMSNDKKLVKSLIDRFNLNMSLSELGKYNNTKVGRVLNTEVTINENEGTDLIGLTINNGLISAHV